MLKSDLYTANSEWVLCSIGQGGTDGAGSVNSTGNARTRCATRGEEQGARESLSGGCLGCEGTGGIPMGVDCLCTSIARPTQGCPACWARGLNNPTTANAGGLHVTYIRMGPYGVLPSIPSHRAPYLFRCAVRLCDRYFSPASQLASLIQCS